MLTSKSQAREFFHSIAHVVEEAHHSVTVTGDSLEGEAKSVASALGEKSTQDAF